MARNVNRGTGDAATFNEPSQARLYEAVLRTNLAAFTQRAFRELLPAARFAYNWHLQQVADGRCRRLLITLPPRSLKSTYASVAFPAYLLGRNPGMRVVCVSYASELQVQHANSCRRLLRALWYRKLFPSTVIDSRKDTETETWTVRSGYRLGTTIGGSLTGRGGDVFIIDDPIKAQDAASELGRNRVNTWFDGTLNSRLDDKQSGSIIILMQRLHEDDLAGHVLSRGEWTHLSLPAIAEEMQTIQTGPGTFHVRKLGDVLHPEREPQQILDELRQSLGSIAFSAQYQQAPVPAGGNMIPWDWFVTYDRLPDRRYGDRIIQSWDTASKANELSDYSVGVTAIVSNGMVWILDVHRERLEYPALRKTIVRKRQEWRADVVLIEDKGSGQSLVQDLRQDRIPVRAVLPHGDKQVRMSACSSLIEAGAVHVPAKANWLQDFKKEMLAFPVGKNDDQADALSQLLNYVKFPPYAYNIEALVG